MRPASIQGVPQAAFPGVDGDRLERFYTAYNRRRYVHPDPLEFLYAYPDPEDREMVALIAASLAYGRVAQILKSVSAVLDRIGPRPSRFLRRVDAAQLRAALSGFVHRFATGEHLTALLLGARRTAGQYGSLHRCLLDGLAPEHETTLPALCHLAGRIRSEAPGDPGHLFPDPRRGSACKRLNLMARWLARRDEVDPGGWDGVPAAKLIVPLDTHMHRVGRRLGFTSRRCPDMKTALAITAGFARLRPDDPVRYDFVLTRSGIRGDSAVPLFDP